MSTAFDLLVVGAGLRGLHRARAALARGQSVRLVERLPYPGGSVRTLRSEGFTCELGAFALPAAEITALLRDLDRPPPLSSLQEQAHTGWTWNGTTLSPAVVDGDPLAGRSGMEDLATAFRRELGDALWLGREVASLRPPDGGLTAGGWTADLGGDPGAVAASVAARAVALCVPLDAAARLCAALDPGLAGAAARLQRRPGAIVFLGTMQDQAAALRGYGVLAEAAGPVREVIFCSNALPRRAAPGKALVRVELAGDIGADDDAAAALAEAEVRRMTGWSGRVVFRRVHRTTELVRDGAYAECSVRLADLARRAPGLLWSPA